jgi:hypothetical protein
MRAPDVQPLAAGVAAILLIASIVWWLASVPQSIDPGQPTWEGADIVRLNAAVPQIADFTEFYTNNENPFVPLNDRIAEREWTNPDRRPGRSLPSPNPIPPPKDSVIVIVPNPPVLIFPQLVPAPSNAPLTYGLVSVDGHEAVIVRMPGATEPVTLKPGDKVVGWTLVSIDEVNFATFLDPDGMEQRFVIGEGDLAVTNSNASAVGAIKAPPAAGQGGPKPPRQGGSKPGMNNGPVPKPPMGAERRPPVKETPQKIPPSK